MPIKRGPQGRVKNQKKTQKNQKKNPKKPNKTLKNQKIQKSREKNLIKTKNFLKGILPKNPISCKIYPKIHKNPLSTNLNFLNYFKFLYP